MATMVAGENERFFQSVKAEKFFHAARTPKCVLRTVEDWFQSARGTTAIVMPVCETVQQSLKLQVLLGQITEEYQLVIGFDTRIEQGRETAMQKAMEAWNTHQYGWHINSGVLDRIAKTWHQNHNHQYSLRNAAVRRMALGLAAKKNNALILDVGCPPMAAFYQSLLLQGEEDEGYVPVLAFK